MTLKRFALLLGATVCAGWVTAGAAVACAICFSGKVNAPGEKIDAADVVVMAVPAQAAGAYVVKEVLKGDLPTGTVVVDVIAARDAPGVSGDRILLVRNRPSQQWSSLGSIGRGEASWLKGLASVDTKPAKPAWPLERVYDMFPRLRERRTSRGTDLSGGEQQMLAIARALTRSPKVLLLDEPFEGLAPTVTLELFGVFDALRQHMSIVIVEHNLDLVLALADRVFALERGAVFHQGPAAPLLNDLGYRKQILWL